MYKRNIIHGFLFIVPFILTIPTFIYLSKHVIILFPNPKYNNQIESFSSQDYTIEDLHFDSHRLTVTYNSHKKENGEKNPYCGIVFWLKKGNTLLDLSGYDFLSLKVAYATADSVVIFLKTFEQGISKPKKEDAYYLRHNEYSLNLEPGIAEYHIDLDDFITPDWWSGAMNIPGDRLSQENYSKAVALDFQFLYRGNDPFPDKDQVFSVTGIAFHKRYPVLFIVLNSITLLYCLFLSLYIRRNIFFRLSKDSIESSLKEIQHKPLELGNHAEQELDRFMKYLEEHYCDPALSIRVISGETGISPSHIRDLVKKRFNYTCKQIINWVRIKEAKRLLKETDRRIVEIALGIGFNDVSTFNRCFKQLEGMSPSQYRNN